MPTYHPVFGLWAARPEANDRVAFVEELRRRVMEGARGGRTDRPGDGVGLGTIFGCTSTDTAPMQIGIDVSGSLGGGPCDAVGTSFTVAPGATVTLDTLATVWIAVADVGHCFDGSARILATSRKLACAAYIADLGNAPPTSMTYLTIIKKTTQKGE